MLCRESQLLEQIDTLKGEVAYWKDEARLVVDDDQRAALTQMFRLTTYEAWVLAALYRRNGQIVSRRRLDEQRPSYLPEDERFGNCVEVFIVRIRKKIGREQILTVYGQGYRLSPEGIALCDAAVANTRREMS